jgi:hypothetical protein
MNSLRVRADTDTNLGAVRKERAWAVQEPVTVSFAFVSEKRLNHVLTDHGPVAVFDLKSGRPKPAKHFVVEDSNAYRLEDA